MGLFDTIIVHSTLYEEFDFTCPDCNVPVRDNFQTKNLECSMLVYHLKRDERGVKLFQLDEPGAKPENTKQRDMGELPNGLIIMSSDCTECNRIVYFDCEFADGILENCARQLETLRIVDFYPANQPM